MITLGLAKFLFSKNFVGYGIHTLLKIITVEPHLTHTSQPLHLYAILIAHRVCRRQ